MMGWLVILHTCTAPYPQDTGSWKVMALFVPAAASKALPEIYLLWERSMRFLSTRLWKYESLRRTGSHLTATIWPTSLQDYRGMYFTCAFGTRLWAAKKKIFYSWALRFSLNSSNAVTKRGFHCAGSRGSFRLGPFVLFEQFCKAGLIYWIWFEGPWLIQQFSNAELSFKPESWIGGWPCAGGTSATLMWRSAAGWRYLRWWLEKPEFCSQLNGEAVAKAVLLVYLCMEWGNLASVKLGCAAVLEFYQMNRISV